MMNKLYFTIVSALLFFAVNSHAYAKIPAFDISCGIAKESADKFSIIKIGTDIPYVTRQSDPNFYFGCTIDTIKSGFTMYHILTVPNPESKIFTSNLDITDKDITPTRLVIKSAPVSYEKHGYIVMVLDDGDVMGPYTIDIYINGVLIKNVTFNVGN